MGGSATSAAARPSTLRARRAGGSAGGGAGRRGSGVRRRTSHDSAHPSCPPQPWTQRSPRRLGHSARFPTAPVSATSPQPPVEPFSLPFRPATFRALRAAASATGGGSALGGAPPAGAPAAAQRVSLSKCLASSRRGRKRGVRGLGALNLLGFRRGTGHRTVGGGALPRRECGRGGRGRAAPRSHFPTPPPPRPARPLPPRRARRRLLRNGFSVRWLRGTGPARPAHPPLSAPRAVAGRAGEAGNGADRTRRRRGRADGQRRQRG
jgi:hypothetical protein